MINHLYVHVPFCKSICYYCDFCHRIYDNQLVNKWLNALSKEIKDVCKDQFKTIYIGGGTPNSLSHEELDRLLSLINPYSSIVEEYTIEINPESFNEKQIELFKKYRINRFSIGLQSSNNNILKTINRKHTYEDVLNVVTSLKKNGFNNISIDLMYSLPNQTIDDLNKTLDDVISLDVPHISIYSLAIEESSVFGKNGITNLDEDTEADMYELIINKLVSNGYEHYEVSNFCKKGYESKHNIGYWDYDDYLGISLSSTSKIKDHRYTTTRNFDSYFDSYKNRDEDLNLTLKDMIIENVMMSLRTNKGLSLIDFKIKYNIDFIDIFKNSLDKFKDDVIIKDNRAVCNNLAILNNILIYFYIDLDTYFNK